MAIPATLLPLAGKWMGKHSLWLTPADPVRECEITAAIETVTGGQAWLLRYTWFEEAAQEGMLLLTQEAGSQRATAFWLDSWHMAHQHMLCVGEALAGGGVSVKGSYRVEGYPEWGWRIEVSPGAADTWQLRMYNITPEGDEALAVEAKFTRAGSETVHEGETDSR